VTEEQLNRLLLRLEDIATSVESVAMIMERIEGNLSGEGDALRIPRWVNRGQGR
jgi:hypothetical protein